MWNFLKSLLKGSKNNKIKPIETSEILSRFIFSKSQFNSTSVKANAFLPPPNNLETSVFRRNYFNAIDYHSLKLKISGVRKMNIKAVGLIEVSKVLDNGLIVNPEETDHKWHANIENWPSEKYERKIIAQELAINSKLE